MEYDEASLAQAVFTSDKESLTDELYDMLIKTGTIHIATVSGFHFNLLGGLLLFLCKFFIGSHRKRTAAVSVIMIAFAFYTGLSIPVLRALIAFLAVSVFDLFNLKHADRKTVFLLIISGFILHSPLIIFDASFILTLVSNGAIVFFTDEEDAVEFARKSECGLVHAKYKDYKTAFSDGTLVNVAAEGIVINPTKEQILLAPDYCLL